jgi:aminoglycoside phosphotransferase (APT) family kinase protein
LSEAGVARAVARQFPALSGFAPRKLGEGFDSEVFEMGPWVLRFPKRAEVQERLARERALLPDLARVLPLALPEFELFGTPCEEFPYTFAGYRKLPGIPLQLCLSLELSPEAEANIAHQLGELLSALHRFRPPAGVALPASEPSRAIDPLPRDEPRLAALRALDSELARQVEQVLAAPAEFSPPSDELVLVHNDLEPEHVLIEPERGALSGVIDWGDVELGRAAADFVGMYSWRGSAFVERMLAHYAGPATRRDLSWMRLRAIHVSLGNLAYGQLSGRAIYVDAGLHGLKRAL